MRKWIKLVLALTGVYLVLCVLAGVVVGEASLKLFRRPLSHRELIANTARQRYQTELQDVNIGAADGVTLKAWYVQPRKFNGNAVVLLHGITDNREGVAGYGRIFLDQGYAVLLPDVRAHGESGGQIATYGIREADDLHRWVSWLYVNHLSQTQCVYGFGESYGAALLLQALPAEPRFCAVAVESPFSTAREMSYERVSGPVHLRPWFGRTVGRPIVISAVLYARIRYGIDLLQPSPLEGIRRSNVPVLLIHGVDDESISSHHSILLAKAAPERVTLWLVPKAGHTMAWAAAHQEFEDRIMAWFTVHRASVKVRAWAIVGGAN